MRNIFIFIFLSLFFASCSSGFFDQVVNIDPPEYQKQLVVYGFSGTLDSNFRAQVSRNVGLLDNVKDSAFYVKNAKVELYEDSQLKLSAPQSSLKQNGWYETFTGPGIYKAGKTYELRVSHPELPTATAQQIMPNPVSVDSVRIREKAGIDNDGTALYSIDVFLHDKPGEKNYYGIKVTTTDFYTSPIFDQNGILIGYDTIQIGEQRVFPYASDDPNAELGDDMLVVSDQFFDGQAYKFSFKSDYYNQSATYNVRVRAITEDQYLYAVSLQRQLDAEDFPLSEPVVVHNNVKNGIGVFCLYNEQLFTIHK
ncbi:MAG: DUF4249 domain-containing protein [Bacteroidota bacterium]